VLLLSYQAKAEQLSARIANYDINVRLDVESKMLYGHTVLNWNNPSADVVEDLQFHMYYNAFKNSESTFMKERGIFDGILGNANDNDCRWSYTTIISMEDEYGNQLVNNMKYIQPDDGNIDDQTVLQVQLANPVEAFGSVTVEFTWEAKVPNIMPRTGYNKDYYFMVQWFPKVGVYEAEGTRGRERGGWSCHQYHSSGEYYGEFGVYQVAITLPSNYVVGASGELVHQAKEADEQTWVFHVDDVIDFGWTASPHFIVQEDQYKDTKIKYYTYPSKTHFSERYFRTIKNALAYMEEHVGPYPYSTLCIIDPPIHGIFSGAMEYPTFVSTTSFCFLPTGIKMPETLATHEFVHQYFMQMISTHEQDEPWMDEGMTTYWESRILDHFDGENSSTIDWLGIKVGNKEFNRWEYFGDKNYKIAEGSRKAREFNHGGYGSIAYNKTAMWLNTLEGIVGQDCMSAIWKSYFNRWKFKHPGGQDFIDVVNETVSKYHQKKFGENMNWFFAQVLYGTEECDYTIDEIDNNEILPKIGYLNNTEDCIAMPDENPNNAETKTYRSKVVVKRLGDMQLPIEVQINFEDGKQINESWSGFERSTEFSYTGTNKIISAEIDPEHKIDIDKNFINNSYTTAPQTKGIQKYFLRALSFIQHTMETVAFLI